MTNTETKVVRIRVRNVGQSFGCCAALVARNGRVLGETRVRPHGMRHVAHADALELAEKHGWTVAS